MSLARMIGGCLDPSTMTDPVDDRDPMNPESWFDEPNVCGSCIAWKPDDPREGEETAAGSCRLRTELRRVPASMAKCDIYKPRGAFRYDPGRSSPRRRKNKVLSHVEIDKDGNEKTITRTRKPRQPRAPRSPEEPSLPVVRDWTPTPIEEREQRPERAPAPATIDFGAGESVPELKQALLTLMRKELGHSGRELHTKFARGGKVEIYAKEGNKLRATSAERFFSMLDRFQISMDRLEKQITAHAEGLGASDTKDMHAAVKRMKGSFTTFNVMYQHKEDQFRSK